MALIVIMTGALLGLYQAGLSINNVMASFDMIKALALGSIALILGSVFPDIDGRGKIRWTIAPIMGAFMITPPFIGKTMNGRIMDGLQFLYNDGSRLFLLITFLVFIILFIPMKHRGKVHTPAAGILFGLLFGGYTWFFASLDLFSGGIICIMGIVGYLWHLSLDGELSA